MAIGFEIDSSDPVVRIQNFLNSYSGKRDGFDGILMQNLRVVSASRSPGPEEGYLARATFEIEVTPQLCNAMQNMHGGAVATLVDMTTTMVVAPIAQPGFWEFGGVSRTLNVTYLAPMAVGTVLSVEAILRSIGKRLSAAQCLVRDKETGKLLAMAEHGKAALGEQKSAPKSRL